MHVKVSRTGTEIIISSDDIPPGEMIEYGGRLIRRITQLTRTATAPTLMTSPFHIAVQYGSRDQSKAALAVIEQIVRSEHQK